MLLPSALPCEARVARSRPTRLSAQNLFASPPTSDEEAVISPAPENGIVSTCRALQSMLAPQLATPKKNPRDFLASPFAYSHVPTPQSRVQKAAPRPPRGVNKRRRAVEDESDTEQDTENHYQLRYSTPKRQRTAPSPLPLGLERSDFEALEQVPESRQNQQQAPPTIEEDWSTEEDQILVELVLDKLQLSKSDWNECARTLGKDKGSIGKRWKDLVGEGSIGLKKKGRGARRPRIDTRR